MRGIVEIEYIDSVKEVYEVNNTEEAIIVWDAGTTQIVTDENNCIFINNQIVRKIKCEGIIEKEVLIQNGNT